MGRYQEEMVKAGILLAGEGLRPTSLVAPFPAGTRLEIRQVFEDDDFAPSDPTV
jgi:hypothetical protein